MPDPEERRGGGRSRTGNMMAKKDIYAEAYALDLCRGHPNIVQLMDAWEHCEDSFLVFGRCGPNLSEFLRKRERAASGALAAVEVRGVVRQLAQALTHIHGLGLLHGDFKPANILVDPDGEDSLHVRLADLGSVARVLGYDSPPVLPSRRPLARPLGLEPACRTTPLTPSPVRRSGRAGGMSYLRWIRR